MTAAEYDLLACLCRGVELSVVGTADDPSPRLGVRMPGGKWVLVDEADLAALEAAGMVEFQGDQGDGFPAGLVPTSRGKYWLGRWEKRATNRRPSRATADESDRTLGSGGRR